jgi:hypothetical protein
MPGGARWDRKVKTKYYLYRYIYIQVCTYAAPESGHWHSPCPLAIWGPWTIPLPPQHAANRPTGRSRCGWARWPNSSSSQPGPVGQSVCGTKTKLITGRYRPVPGTGNGAGHSDPVDPVTRWDNLAAWCTAGSGQEAAPKWEPRGSIEPAGCNPLHSRGRAPRPVVLFHPHRMTPAEMQ